MQNHPELEKDHQQIQYVKVDIPYKRVMIFLATAIALQAAVSAIAIYLYSNERIIDICTIVALFFFLVGSFMWGKFPSVDDPIAGYIVDRNHLDAEMDGRKSSLSNKIRGGLIMLSSVLFLLCIAAIVW